MVWMKLALIVYMLYARAVKSDTRIIGILAKNIILCGKSILWVHTSTYRSTFTDGLSNGSGVE
jgi:hypothetical protein